MSLIGFDTETGLISRGCLIPRLTCLSLAGAGDRPPAWAVGERGWVRVFRAPHGGHEWRTVLDRRDAVNAVLPLFSGEAVGHNVMYDLAELAELHREETGTPAAIEAIWEALACGRIYDTKIRETLLRIAHGELEYQLGPDGIQRTKFDLAALVLRYLGVDISETKSDPDAWRLRYAELDGVPLTDWPESALEYAALDAVWPLHVGRAQILAHQTHVDGFPLHDGQWAIVSEGREVAAALALHCMAVWGLRTDPVAVDKLIAEWRAGSEAGRALGRREGWIRVKGRDKGKPDTVDKGVLQRRVLDAYAKLPHVDPSFYTTAPSKTFPQGQTKTSEEVLESSGDPALVEYALSLHFTNWLSKYAEPAQIATTIPLTSKPNVLVSSGRTSWADPALHQPPRKGGYRECHVPRAGWLYTGADYDFVELCAIAQVCLWEVGHSTLAETINAGRDPHLITACSILDAYDHPDRPRSYEEAVARKGEELIAEHRQLAKAVNFGLPGGLGPDSFVEYAHATYGLTITSERAAQLKEIWLDAYPEMRSYFRWVLDQLGDGETVQQRVSGRVRGGCRATAAFNTYFQGLVADGAKWACWTIEREAQTDPTSPLYGTRGVLFLHDEIIREAPEDRAAEAADRQAVLMVEAMRLHIPDVLIGASPLVMRRWYKGAKPIRDASGRLVPVGDP